MYTSETFQSEDTYPYDEDDDEPFTSRPQRADVDPYAGAACVWLFLAGHPPYLIDPGIFFSKDRREEVIEVEEEPETAYIPLMDETVKLMTQGEWMKGCPEGGEQGLLFTLYRDLSEGHCKCPQCGTPIAIARQKQDFFALFVSCNVMRLLLHVWLILYSCHSIRI